MARGEQLTAVDTPTRTKSPDNGAEPTRPVPYDEHVERSLLGSALLDPSRAAHVLAALDPKSFYVVAHQHIAVAILAELFDTGTVDTITVADRLRSQGLLDAIGGGQALVALTVDTPASYHAARYATIVTDLAQRRDSLTIGHEIVERSRNGQPIDELITQLVERQAAAGVDELALEDMGHALDDRDEDKPTVLARSDGGFLLYPAAVNGIQSEPSVGKSWLAILAAAEVINAGDHVLWLDYEDTPRRIARRLLTVGLTRTQIVEQFHYLRPGTLTPAALAGLPRLAARHTAALVVIDGVAAAMSAQGHDENDASAFYAWYRTMPAALADIGACVLLLDHVTKSKDSRGRYARGSGSKLAAISGACYGLEAIAGETMSRHRASKLKLTVEKDREGHVGATGEIAAVVTFTPAGGGTSLSGETDPAPTQHAEWSGPTNCMAAVQRLFEELGASSELAKSAVSTQLKATQGSAFHRETIYQSLERLVIEGVLFARSGAKSGRYYRLNADRPDAELPLETDAYEPF